MRNEDHVIYKIHTDAQWKASRAQGRIAWADVDRADGFVHLSAAHQVRETAEKWFAGQTDLWLVTIDVERVDAGSLRWETSRGGDAFPHVYGEIGLEAVVRADRLPWSDGRFNWPAGV